MENRKRALSGIVLACVTVAMLIFAGRGEPWGLKQQAQNQKEIAATRPEPSPPPDVSYGPTPAQEDLMERFNITFENINTLYNLSYRDEDILNFTPQYVQGIFEGLREGSEMPSEVEINPINESISRVECYLGDYHSFYGEYISEDELVLLSRLKVQQGERLPNRVDRVSLKEKTIETLYVGDFSADTYQLNIAKTVDSGLRIDTRDKTLVIDKHKNSREIRYPTEFSACVLLKDNETLVYIQDNFFGLYNTKTKEKEILWTLSVKGHSINNFLMVNETETKAVYTRMNYNETMDVFSIDLVNTRVEKKENMGGIAYAMGEQIVLRDNGNYDPDLNGSIRILDSDLTEQVRLENSGAEILDSAKGVLLYETKNKEKVSDPVFRLPQSILNVYDGKETIHLKDEIERVVTIISAKFSPKADEMLVILNQYHQKDAERQVYLIKR